MTASGSSGVMNGLIPTEVQDQRGRRTPPPRGWCRSGHRPPPALAARVSSPRVRDPFLQGLAGELGNGLTLSGGDGSGALTQGCAG